MTDEAKDLGGFDLAEAAPVADLEDQGTLVHVRDTSGELMYYRETEEGDDLPVTIRVAGTYSTRYRRAMESQNTRTLRKKNVVLTGELLTANRLDLIAKCVLDWQGFAKVGPPSPENVRKVMGAAPWIREQIEQTMEDHQAFFEQG